MLNIFVNTWGNYNENGADGGAWITLPKDADELQELLEQIAENMGDTDPEFAIHDYEWTCEWEGFEISEYANIEELNEFCQRLSELNDYESKVYAAAVEYYGRENVEIDEIDEFNLYTDITDNYDLGYYWAVESGCYNTDELGTLGRYIDYEGFGRDIALEADGGFTTYGFIERC
ncbi:MAG: antirestriction protein ArdA [Bacteroidales bacterium]|nr:antirestriction protein ArdA [Bacteroidales bacterium]